MPYVACGDQTTCGGRPDARGSLVLICTRGKRARARATWAEGDPTSLIAGVVAGAGAAVLLLLSIGGVRAGHDSGIASRTAVRSLLFDTTYSLHSQSEGLTFTWTHP